MVDDQPVRKSVGDEIKGVCPGTAGQNRRRPEDARTGSRDGGRLPARRGENRPAAAKQHSRTKELRNIRTQTLRNTRT